MNVDLDRAKGALLGLAVGDALGTPLEFSRRDSLPAVTDMTGGGPFGLMPGEWTDDTSMALALADSLIEKGSFEPDDVMSRFVRWYRDGENSVNGRCFDIGIATREALQTYERTGKTAASAREDPYKAGNGTLMRLAPVVIFAAPDLEAAVALAEEQSALTHPASVAHEACRLFATQLVEAMTGQEKEAVLRPRSWEGALTGVAIGEWRDKTRRQISSSGYSVATLEAALWSVGQTSSFEEAVLLAVNLGDDADTVGAVTGQLAGALYGMSGIPQRWLEALAWRDHIEGRAEALVMAGQRSKPGGEVVPS